jgi:hypothetical protein
MEMLPSIPLGAVDASARFAVLDADLQLVSEHDDAEPACLALAGYILRTQEDGVIVERTAEGWVEF